MFTFPPLIFGAHIICAQSFCLHYISGEQASQDSMVRCHDITWLTIDDIALFRWLVYIVAIKQEQLLAHFFLSACFS